MSFFTVVYSLACFLLVLLPGTEAVQTTFTTIPPSLTKVEGQNMTLIWDISFTGSQVYNAKVALMKTLSGQAYGELYYSPSAGTVSYRKGWTGLEEKIMLNVTISGQTCKVVFTMKNLNKTTDQGYYVLYFSHSDDAADTGTADKATLLTVNIPVSIITAHHQYLFIDEGEQARLVCEATGFPTPTINWTRNGVIVHTGSPYNTPVLTCNDNNALLTCHAYNGVGDAKTATYHLYVRYKPRNATLTVDRSTVLQNDTVTLTCISGTSNPAPSSYKFYYNDVLMQNSTWNIYSTRAAHVLPDVNRFTCVPRNYVGDAVENATLNVTAYGPAVRMITAHHQNLIIEEGERASLVCEATGFPTPTINWTRNAVLVHTGSPYNTPVLTYNDNNAWITCIAYNAVQDAKTAKYHLNVRYKPRYTTLTVDRLRVRQNDNVTLTCISGPSNPAPSSYKFYYNDVLMQTSTWNIYSTRAAHVLPDVNRFTCVPRNDIGDAVENATLNVTAYVPVGVITAHNQYLIIDEGERASLVCEATGKPIPTINWTRNGVLVHTGSPYNTPVLTYSDNNAWFKCIAYNGAGDAKTVMYHLNVRYKPRNTTLTVDRLTVRQNDHVTLTCTSGPSNPTPSSYKFYYNDVLVQNSTCNVYSTRAAHVLHDVNRFACAPRNYVGDAVENATLNVIANEYETSATPRTGDKGCQVSTILLGILFSVSLVANVIFVGYFVWRYTKENKAKSDSRSSNINEMVKMNNIAFHDQMPSNASLDTDSAIRKQQQSITPVDQSVQTDFTQQDQALTSNATQNTVPAISQEQHEIISPVYESMQSCITEQDRDPSIVIQNAVPAISQEQHEIISPVYESMQSCITEQDQDASNVIQNAVPAISQEQHQPSLPVYQSVQAHTDIYSSLNPDTKLPPINPRCAILTQSSPYEDDLGTLHDYQSLDGFSRV